MIYGIDISFMEKLDPSLGGRVKRLKETGQENWVVIAIHSKWPCSLIVQVRVVLRGLRVLLVIVTDIQQPEQKSSSESSDLPDWLKPVEILI